jgi:amino acid transporter
MASRDMAPRLFARVHPFTRTPLLATLLVGAVVLLLSTSFPLTRLAETSSFVLLLVFALVSLALAAVRWREGLADGVVRVPWLPLLAAGSCLLMVVLRLALF